MPSFGAGVAQTFGPALKAAQERKRLGELQEAKDKTAQEKLDRELEKAKDENMAAALAAVQRIKEQGGDPKSLLPFGVTLGEGELMSDWIKKAPRAALLGAAAKAEPMVKKLEFERDKEIERRKHERTQREASEARQDVMRGQKWTDPRDGTLKIPENMRDIYQPGSLRHRNLVTASGDYSIALKKPKDDLWNERAGDAQELLSEIQIMSGSYIMPWDDMTRKQQDNWVSEHGFNQLEAHRTALGGYIERFGEPPTYDIMLGEEKVKLEAEIAENQRVINEGSQVPAVLNIVKRETFKLRRRLSVLHAKTTNNVASLEMKNKAFDDALKGDKDKRVVIWEAGKAASTKAVNDFNRLIKAQEFKNGKNERNILVGKPNEEGEQDTLWQRTYFRKVHLKGEDGKNTEHFYVDVKPEFKKWLTTYKETIPQFLGGGTVITLNQAGAERSILYLPDQKKAPPKQLPGGRVEKPPPAEQRVGQPGLEAFWVESPTILGGPPQHERDRVRLLHRIGPDGNIEAPVEPEPKLLEPGGNLKRVPRRGEPRADADEAANLFEDAKADAKAMTTLVEFFRQATAEEKAAMEAVRGDEEAQIAILRGIMQRVNKPVD